MSQWTMSPTTERKKLGGKSCSHGDRKYFFSGYRDLWHQFIYIDPPPPPEPPPPPPPLLVKHLQNLSVEKIVRVLAASVIRFNHSLLHGTCLACRTQFAMWEMFPVQTDLSPTLSLFLCGKTIRSLRERRRLCWTWKMFVLVYWRVFLQAIKKCLKKLNFLSVS